MKWRKEDWKNPYSILPEHMERGYNVLPEWSAYEAGADAMFDSVLKLLEELGWARAAEDIMLYTNRSEGFETIEEGIG